MNVFSRIGMVTLVATGLALSGCGGGGNGGGGGTPPAPGSSTSPPPPSPTATPSPPGASTQTINTFAGASIGQTGAYSPPEGDAPGGGQGAAVDGITCDPTMSNNYHIHAYVGVFYNGTQMALPYSIGMVNPAAPVNGFVNAASCFYHIHTHDSSGIVHVEDPDPTNAPITQSLYTLQNFLDIWGITTDANHFGPFTGNVNVFTSGQTYRGGNGTTSASDLSFYGQNAGSVPIYSHEVIYIVVGTPPATLPNVNFYETY